MLPAVVTCCSSCSRVHLFRHTLRLLPFLEQILYALLLDLIAKAGYTVVATPYAVTFRHLDSAAKASDRVSCFLQA